MNYFLCFNNWIKKNDDLDMRTTLCQTSRNTIVHCYGKKVSKNSDYGISSSLNVSKTIKFLIKTIWELFLVFDKNY